jgi:hypothetical protein
MADDTVTLDANISQTKKFGKELLWYSLLDDVTLSK